ncbi:MAG: serine/threonine-protein kinase PknK, partial [Acidobacteria bacterium]|nr:serine/threonine-protein kinase PknK [Acidobacteriota bacterium]
MATPTKGLINSRYRIKSPLGAGGMGSVHLAEDRATGNALVALKIVTHEAAEEALTHEFEILARLRHPHLPAVYDFGAVEGEPSHFLSMEYIQGQSLVEAAADLSADEALDLVAQICRALEFVHTRGLVHRDLKPDNVLVTGGAGERRAVLVDFGLASRARAEGVAAGTLAYVSPEALKGGTIDGRSDLYALGVMLYQLTTGRCPFEGSGKEIVRGHLELEPTPPSAAAPTGAAAPLRPLLEPALSAIILRLLSKEPSQRFASAAETLQAINRATGRRHPIETAETGVAYATWAPLVGREAELARLTALVDRPRGGLLALITGEAGVGKTRFLSEARRHAQVHGKLAAGVACRPGMP